MLALPRFSFPTRYCCDAQSIFHPFDALRDLIGDGLYHKICGFCCCVLFIIMLVLLQPMISTLNSFRNA
jgi:hypothetical protein